MADSPKSPFKSPWVTGIGGFILGAILSGPLGNLGTYILDEGRTFIFPQVQEVTIDFNATRACSQGRLVAIREMFADSNTPLTNGADTLSICDTESLQTVRPNLPYELSKRFPGCLVWRGKESGGLVMVRKSDAICAVPGGADFICEGAKARHFTGTNSIADSVDAVKPCSDDTLRKFGFRS
ncbi:hypothetical protein [Mesorhizobium australicum]|uniref:hypothetical protein n=1 Tax=Mesorhizobium australicum TaxID=536018 RepID=UPI00333AB877